MASRIKDNIGLAGPENPVAADYSCDFYSWLMEQARHVREGRWDSIDPRKSCRGDRVIGARTIQQARKRIARVAAAFPEMGSPAKQEIAKLDALDRGPATRNRRRASR